jgi:hypothetical protein
MAAVSLDKICKKLVVQLFHGGNTGGFPSSLCREESAAQAFFLLHLELLPPPMETGEKYIQPIRNSEKAKIRF